MRYLIAGAAALFLAAAPAAAEQVGQWDFSSSKTFCTGVNKSLSTPDKVLMIMTGDGGNDGGIVMGGEGFANVSDGPQILTIQIGKKKPFNIEVDGMSSLPGYWIPLGTTRDLVKYPDKFRMVVKKGDEVIFDGEFTAFKKAVKYANECDIRVTRASQ